MQIQEATEADQLLYNSFVANNNGSFLQCWEWGEWQEQNGRKAARYVVQDNDNNNDNGQNILLAAQVIVYALPFGQKYVYIPYGPVCKTGADASLLQEALNKLIAQIKANYPKYLFIRIEPANFPAESVPGNKSLNIQPASTIILDITKPAEELLARMHPKTRYNIKVAQRHGIEVRLLTDTSDKTAAAQLFFDTLHRRKLVTPPASYYRKLMDLPDPESNLGISTYGAFFEQRLIAAALMADFGNTRTYVFGGSSTEHKNVMAPYLLHWTAIQDAKNKGYTTYDWFGAEGSVSDGSGFARFKQGFGGATVHYPGAHDLILRPLPHRVYSTIRALNRWIKRRQF